MKRVIITIKLFLILTIITGIVYPMLITLFAQLAFPGKANGSLIIKDDRVIGSELIGQQFYGPEYFHGRPSAVLNNPAPSGGSNLNPVGETLKGQVQARVDSIRQYHGNISINNIPEDLLFASASGVDPHISPAAAYFQVDRIVKYRHLNDTQKNMLIKLIESAVEKPDLFIFGEYRVNILLLNLKLSELCNGNT